MTSPARAVACIALSLLAIAGCTPSTTTDPVNLDSVIQPLLPDDTTHTVAVSVIDPSSDTRFHHRGERLFHAASTMKIPVMIEVFRQDAAGRLPLDSKIEVRNLFRSIVDSSEYSIEDDSDDAIYERLGSKMTVRELTENMIVVSSNLATNILIDLVGADSVQATSERLGTEHMITLRGVEDLKAYRQGLSNRTTSYDLAVLLNAIMTGEAVSPAASDSMTAILARQQFNSMIPAGLPDTVTVAHKTGWITEIHHDAAIVLPPEAPPYVLVILTEGYADEDESAALGARIARAVHEHLRPAS